MTVEMKKSNRIATAMDHKVGFSSGGYACRICKKRFDTFQALGGHQGTHKKVKVSDDNDACLLNLDVVVPRPSGLHQCKTCMKEFGTGQALGGHMRRHRLERALILMEKQRPCQQQVAEKVAEKIEIDLMSAGVELQQVKAEEDKQNDVKSELVLAAKEWRLSV